MSKVAIQGIRGSYSDAAVVRLLGQSAGIMECENFAAVFQALEIGEAERAVVPVKNRIVGDIATVANWIAETKPKIIDRIRLNIDHVLAAVPGTTFEEILLVVSHPEALKQCGKFLLANPQIASVAAADTASSVRRIMSDGMTTQAAICSREAAAIYGAHIIRDDVADEKDNWTEFVLVELNKE